MNGYFITFEGVEGAGKTTQAAMTAEHLREAGFPVLITREPGGTSLGEQLRKLLKDISSGIAISAMAELLMMEAARAQHVHDVILPALEGGKVVICDRYVDASFAYQGMGRGLNLRDVWTLNMIATGGVMPNLTILLDLPIEKGFERVAGRNKSADAPDKTDRFESMNSDFHVNVRKGYLKLALEHPDRIVVINASDKLDKIKREILEAVEPRLKLYFRKK